MDVKTIKTFDNYFLANIILTRLQADGIECYLNDENTVTINPILNNVVGGIKLVVKAEDEANAISLLQQYQAEHLKTVQCPRCGGNHFDHVMKQDIPNIVTAIFTWFFSSFADAPKYA